MDDLTLDKWDGLSPAECEARAKRLARELPTGFAFCRVRPCHLGSQERLVAEFQYQEASFVLIPGGSTTLGYDANRPWEPNPDEEESWEGTAAEYEIEGSLTAYIANVTLRPRSACFKPFLMETKAGEIGWERASLDDPDVRDAMKYLGGGTHQGGVVYPDREIRLTRQEDGSIHAERSVASTHAVLSQSLQEEGFRFPTSDEWEYACGSGASTLFRWGDHVPCDRYPGETGPEERAWRMAWVLSGGKAEPPPEGFSSNWDLHRRPNAFGVFIASDPYKYELTAASDITRGGDGGSMICGGAGFFVGWLTLATAYFEEHVCKRHPEEPIQPGFTIARRVFPLE